MACKYTSEQIKPYFTKLGNQLQKYINNLEGLDPEDSLRSFRTRILEKDDQILSEVVDLLIEDQFGTYASEVIDGDADITYEANLLPRELRAISRQVVDFSQIIADVEVDIDNREDSEGEFEEINGNNTFMRKISEVGMQNFDVLYNRFTGYEHSPKEMREILEQIRYSSDFNEFYDWVTDTDRGYNIIGADMEARKNPIYFVDKNIQMMRDTRYTSEDNSGDARDVWIVSGEEAALKQLANIKKGKGKGSNFADELEFVSEDHWILRHKQGDDKYIYTESSKPSDEYLIRDDKGRLPDSMYFDFRAAERKVQDRRRGLHTFYNVYNSVIHRSERYEFIIANVDPNNLKGLDHDSEMGLASLTDDGKSLNPRLIAKPSYDMKNKINLGEYVARNAIDESDAKIRGRRIGDPAMTGYFNLGDSGRVQTYDHKEENGRVVAAKWWFIPLSLKNITEKTIQNWEYALANQHTFSTTHKGKEYSSPLALVMPTPGSNATFFTTRVLHEQIEELFPKKELIKALSKI
jgi:hypothetical protein